MGEIGLHQLDAISRRSSKVSTERDDLAPEAINMAISAPYFLDIPIAIELRCIRDLCLSDAAYALDMLYVVLGLIEV